MSTLDIQPGKLYRTRDGHKARVYATDGRGQHSVHGALLQKDGWNDCSWTASGHHYSNTTERGADLISEWIDKPEVNWSAMPAWAEWVAMDFDGQWFWFKEQPDQGSKRWICDGPFGPIPSSYTPTFSGDWKDSLVQRPQP